MDRQHRPVRCSTSADPPRLRHEREQSVCAARGAGAAPRRNPDGLQEHEVPRADRRDGHVRRRGEAGEYSERMGVVRGDLTVRSTFLGLLVLASSGLFVGGTPTQVPERKSLRDRASLSPAEALASFELEPGYRIELAAAEPLIRNPVAIAFDHRGRMYVAESRGYPGPLEGAPPSAPEGVIALLEDTNHDGRFDKRTDFARHLTFPNGILPWDGGVFVTCAPDLVYLKDTTGDGVADERRVVLTGFDATKTPQFRFSHPTL